MVKTRLRGQHEILLMKSSKESNFFFIMLFPLYKPKGIQLNLPAPVPNKKKVDDIRKARTHLADLPLANNNCQPILIG